MNPIKLAILAVLLFVITLLALSIYALSIYAGLKHNNDVFQLSVAESALVAIFFTVYNL